MLVEDNPGDADLVEERLDDSGLIYDLHRASTVLGAREVLSQNQVDAILLDLGLPDSQGLDTVRAIQAVASSSSIIVLTGHDDAELATRAIQNGVQDYLVKGAYSAEMLHRTIRYSIERKLQSLQLDHINRMLSTILQINQLIVHQKDMQQLIEDACTLLREARGYCGVWIALCNDTGKPSMYAQSGWREDFMQVADDLDKGILPPCHAQAMQGNESVIVEAQQLCLHCPLWKACKHDMALVMPLKHEGIEVGLLAISLPSGNVAENEEITIIQEVAGDIAFAIRSIQVDKLRQKSEGQFQRLFQSMAQGVVFQDRSGQITHANPAAEKILGLTLEELQGRSSIDPRWKTIHEDGSDFPGEEHYAMVALKTGAAAAGLMGVFNPQENDHRWIKVHAIPEFLPGVNSPYRVFSTFEDVTDLRRAEEELREKKDFAELLLDTAQAVILILDNTGRIVSFNSYLEDLTGFALQEVAGRKWIPTFIPQREREAVQKLFEETVNDMPTSGKTNSILTKRGDEIHIEWHNKSIKDKTGAAAGVLAVGQNVSERKLTEDLYRVRLELMEFSVAHTMEATLQKALDEIGELVQSPISFYHFMNPDQKTLSLQQWSTRTLAEFCTAQGHAVHYSVDQAGVWADCVREMRPVIHNDYNALPVKMGMPEGHAELIRELVVPVIRDKHIVAIVGVGNKPTDYGAKDVRIVSYLADIVWEITERKLTERRKAELENQLRQSQKMEAIGRLSGGVAHDFNNLLTVIQGYCEIIEESLGDDDRNKESLRQIIKASNSAAGLTQQLLAFSSKQIIAPQIIDVNSVLLHSKELLRRLIGEDIDLAFYSGKDVGRIKMDASQVDQVLVNLAINARDAMPAGGKLTFETKMEHLDGRKCQTCFQPMYGEYVMIAVSDTGTGMDAATQAQIFEPFFTTKEKGKGTGLGLSTILGIIHQNGGHINVYSEPGIGTTFKMYLPRTREKEKISRTFRSKKELQGSETILLAEDMKIVRQLAKKVLTLHGYNVIEAENGEEAQTKAQEAAGAIDLLLTDVVMPKMSGRQLYDMLAADIPGLPVLYMSGYTDNAIAHHGILDEGTNFIQKPFKPNDLMSKIRAVLDDAARISDDKAMQESGTVLCICDDESWHQIFAGQARALDIDILHAHTGQEGLDLLKVKGGAITLVLCDDDLPDYREAQVIRAMHGMRENLRIVDMRGAVAAEAPEGIAAGRHVVHITKPEHDLECWAHIVLEEHVLRPLQAESVQRPVFEDAITLHAELPQVSEFDMTGLANDVIGQLIDAVESGNGGEFRAILAEQKDALPPSSHVMLKHLIDQYDYPRIIKLLKGRT